MASVDCSTGMEQVLYHCCHISFEKRILEKDSIRLIGLKMIMKVYTFFIKCFFKMYLFKSLPTPGQRKFIIDCNALAQQQKLTQHLATFLSYDNF